MNQYNKAIKLLKKAERMNRKDANINFLLSRCYKNIANKVQFNRELAKLLIKCKNRDTRYANYTLSTFYHNGDEKKLSI